MPPVFCIMSPPLCFSIIVANRYLLFCYRNFILKTNRSPCVTLAVVGYLLTTVPNVGPWLWYLGGICWCINLICWLFHYWLVIRVITSKCWCLLPLSVSFVLLSPVHTVAEKCDCRRIRRQSHFSATVSLFCDSVDRALVVCIVSGVVSNEFCFHQICQRNCVLFVWD